MKQFFSDKSTILIAVIISLLCSLISALLYLWSPAFIEELDLRLSDVRFRQRGEVQPNENIAIIAIDEKSINEIGRWPWSRDKIAEIVNSLNEYNAGIVSFDVVFSEEQDNLPDAKLGKAIDSSDNVILGYFFRDDSTDAPDTVSLDIHERSKIKLVKLSDDADPGTVKKFDSAEFNIPVIGKNARGFGFFNIIPDNDGIYRHAPLIINFNGTFYPSLNLISLKHFLNKEILLSLDDFGVSAVMLNKLRIPADERGRLLLNYYGKSGKFNTYSAVDVLNNQVPRENLEGKLLFLGATEIGIADIRATPFDPVSPGVEIQATAASNLLDGNFLIKDGSTRAVDLLIIFLLPLLLAIILSAVKKTLSGFLILVFFLISFFAINIFLFSGYNIMLSLLYPVFPLAMTYVFYEVYRNVVVERKSKFLKNAFSSYVSGDVVEEIIKDPDRLQLGGDRKKVTLLFSDIRGFTSLAEKISPEQLVTLLNEYLTPMTEIVMKNNGTLDKFIGDAVMAIYGAPIELPDQALRACVTANEMINKLKEINESWTERNLPNISIGIGINTGDSIVGNMGANVRFDYTAIGDEVNLAARIEGLTKFYGVNIIVSESTKNEVDQYGAGSRYSFNFRELDSVRVKGKKLPVTLYELLDEGNKEFELVKESYSKALLLYKNREFQKSLDLFTNILGELRSDKASEIYIARCMDYLEKPPPDDWDYVYIAESKEG